MAYVFNGIDQLLGKDQEKQSIFGQPQGQEGGQEQPQGMSTMGAGGDYIPASGAAGSSTQQVAAPKAQQKAVMRNVSEQSAPTGFVNKVGSQLNQAQQGLQDEANSYTQGIQGRTDEFYGYNPDLIQQAIKYKPGSESFGKVASALSNQVYETPQYQQKTPTEIKDVSLLGTNAGLGQALARNQDEQYTAGEQTLDAMLLGKNTGFQQDRQNLINQQAQINALAAKYRTELPAVAEEAIKKGSEGAKTKIRGDLTAAQQALVDQQSKDAEEETMRRRGLSNPDPEWLKNHSAEALSGMSGNWNVPYGINPEMASSTINPADYYSMTGIDVTPDQMITGDESNQYNNIMALLGSGGQQWNESIPLADPRVFDRQGYQSAVSANAAKMVEAEAIRQAEIEAERQRQANYIPPDGLSPAMPGRLELGIPPQAPGWQPATTDTISAAEDPYKFEGIGRLLLGV